MKERLLQDLEKRFKSVSQLRNLAQSYDEGLFHYLLEESEYKEELKNRFFVSCGETLIFKSDDFLSFLNLRKLSGSFTSYANKIGLSSKTKAFLKSQSEVVLNFAFKDGVIKGGQSKDEQKSQEIFFNEILARDEIDVLFAKKALQNFEFLGQEKSLKDANFLIKGNNLLALHSLKKRYASKVKLIYIDPPYNTGNDSFNYNDKFNHSTWLSFMKNRLEVAREFLREDGVIFIQCDDNEQAYLKVLCDEIFGRENFVACFMWEKTSNSLSRIRIKTEYILCYEKTKFRLIFNGDTAKEGQDFPILNEVNMERTLEFPPNVITFKTFKGTIKPTKFNKMELIDDLIIANETNSNKVRINAKFKWTQDKLDDEIKEGTTFVIKSNEFSMRYIRKGDREVKVSNVFNAECEVTTNIKATSEIRALFAPPVIASE